MEGSEGSFHLVHEYTGATRLWLGEVSSQLPLHFILESIRDCFERQVAPITEAIVRHVPVVPSQKTEVAELLVLFDMFEFMREQRDRV